MKVEDYIAMLVICIVLILALWISVGVFTEACDAYNNWTCGIADDGFQDGEFNWRHGVFPW